MSLARCGRLQPLVLDAFESCQLQEGGGGGGGDSSRAGTAQTLEISPSVPGELQRQPQFWAESNLCKIGVHLYNASRAKLRQGQSQNGSDFSS